MFRHTPSFITVACLAALISTGFADTVTLKDGSKVEGKITSETDTEIVIDEKISASITDARTIKKADVASVQKEAPDELAWPALSGYKVTGYSLQPGAYEMAITALKGFVTQFPKSAHAADAQKVADAFAEEKKRVDDGAVKLDGKWLTKEEVQKERYQIGALLVFNQMKDLSTRDAVGALNSFAALEKSFPGARVYPDAVDLAKRLLPSLKAEVDRRLAAYPALKAEREKSVQMAPDNDKATLQAALKREQAAADAAVAAAEKQQLKWAPMISISDKSLQSLNNKIPSEVSRLGSLNTANMRSSLATAEKARVALEKSDLPATEAALQEATKAWPANELATRLTTDLTAAKATAAATPAPVVAAPVAAVETPAPKPSVSASTPASDAATKETEESDEKPFLLTPGGAITVVILVALLVVGYNTFKKIRSKANDVLE